MDRDPRENIIDPVERFSPTSGDNDTGEVGDCEARVYQKRSKHAAPPQAKEAVTVKSRQDGEDPDAPTDRRSEIAHPGIHGGAGSPGWQPGR